MQTELNCDSAGPLISAWRDNELDETETRALKRHLAHCPACQVQAMVFEKVDSALDSLSRRPRDTNQVELGSVERQQTSAKSKRRMDAWRLIPLTAAAALLVCLAIAAWPNPQPVNANLISPEQFVQPIKELQILNDQKQRDQVLMLRTLEMDLRSLRLEVKKLAPAEPTTALESKIETMINKVNAFFQQ